MLKKTVDHFLGGWGIQIFSNFTGGIQVIIDAFAHFKHMAIATIFRVK